MISSAAQVQVVRVKNRMHRGYDASHSAGFRSKNCIVLLDA